MKKTLLTALTVYGISAVAYAAPCANLTANLIRGAESNNVLVLQNFLLAKGYLKAGPNGYFGPATEAAVKLYQKSVALPQTGAVLTLTRAALLKEACSATSLATTSPQTVTQPVHVYVSTSTPLQNVLPVPVIASLDSGTLFASAESDWNMVITGTGFSTSTTRIYFKNRNSNRKYLIGTFQSDGANITLPVALTKESYSCGAGCKETLAPGDYDVTAQTDAGESGAAFVSIKSFISSSQSGSLSSPVKQNATSTLLGTISFSSSAPGFVTNFSIDFGYDGLSSNPLSNVVFKDELTGQVLTTFGSSVELQENQSKIIGIYGDLSSTNSGTLSGKGVITIQDYVGKKKVTFVTPQFLTTISGFKE